ncbi:uncharacterized protein LOC131429133 [Malaya genurostris]|uniref:uncharacterized protein LOC131429133 n=1 Tax=Malaya genurostris TaxID=325434 RepID=UPI0026F391E3|nr:uncharacterized protein LOC131429133 [Malaya genurostris]
MYRSADVITINGDETYRMPLGTFNDKADSHDLRREWEEWHRAFELYLEMRNIEAQHDKLVTMLAVGGRGLQRIFFNLRPGAEEITPEPVKIPLMPPEIPEYDNAIKRLEKFFVGKRNERVELEVFRSIRQSSQESFNNFILRLRSQASRCEFSSREETEILQQITMGARDDKVRDKGLENAMTLDEVINYAINREILVNQREKLKPFRGETELNHGIVNLKDNLTVDKVNQGNSMAVSEFNATAVDQQDMQGILVSVSLEVRRVIVVDIGDTMPGNASQIVAANESLAMPDVQMMKIVGLDVFHVDTHLKPFPKFPGILVKLAIDQAVPPKKVAYLRIPAAMEKRVDDKIQEMLQTDVIERVIESPDWISPMVIVPKGKDDIRICINMKHPNEAIQREHYPLPVIDTFLNRLRGAKFYSRLDITSAYHHVELHPESRGVTTFMTGKGLMRFKRLMFGINCAPEIFQRIMVEMLAGAEGVIVYIDDIVVAGRTKEEHDKRLVHVLGILKRNNAMLNERKCVIGVRELQILGFKVIEQNVLSE